MKKFFSIFSLVMAIASVSFVSCSNDDDVINDLDPQGKQSVMPQEKPVEQYVAYKFWASDDLLAIADVTCTGLYTSYDFSTPKKDAPQLLEGFGIDGKEGQYLEFCGDNYKADFTMSFKLKENWKSIIGDKKSVDICFFSMAKRDKNAAEGYVYTQIVCMNQIDMDKVLNNEDFLKQFCEIVEACSCHK